MHVHCIITDLYRKETDRVQYLLPSSCHPSHVFNHIPYSLALRLVRICSNRDSLLQRMDELKEMLISRAYNKNIITAAINSICIVLLFSVCKPFYFYPFNLYNYSNTVPFLNRHFPPQHLTN